ncbi:MAG: sodium-independent anion transporter, partial [Xenococcaceae cyanobacterium MO_188.B19]|nr:sodium-independent anion transporter [Xenococcaceae cyanobacterium MO_188.B19]
NYQVLVLDLSEVSLLDVTSSLALEKVITEALEKQRQVFLAGVHGQAEELLSKLDIMNKIPKTNFFNNRTEALRTALIYLEKSGLTSNSTSKRVIPFRKRSQN